VGVAAEAGGVPAVDGDKCAGTRLWAPGNKDDPLRGGVKGRLAWNGKGGSGELLIDIDAVDGRQLRDTTPTTHDHTEEEEEEEEEKDEEENN